MGEILIHTYLVISIARVLTKKMEKKLPKEKLIN